MSNRPVFGIIHCPFCNFENPVYWNGNYKWYCIKCQKRFVVKRQRLYKVETAPKCDIERKEYDMNEIDMARKTINVITRLDKYNSRR